MAIFDRKDDYHFVRWARAVKKRDHYMCQICERRGDLNSHHLNAWNTFPDERYDIDNGTTLCVYCHEDFHAKYGKGGNTAEQFYEYSAICDIFIRAISQKISVERSSTLIISKLKDGYG